MRLQWQRMAVRVAALAAAPFLIGATDLTSNFETRVLAAQNRERQAMGVEPFSWNVELAADAKRWAEHLAVTGKFEHAHERPIEPQGENLWEGTRGYFAIETMVNGWIREKRYFHPGTFPDNSTTGRVEDIGHYTQLMWRQTRQIGCAMASGVQEDILVCRYSAAGNYIGETPF